MTERERAIHEVRARLQDRVSTRAHMLVLVLATAACGLLASFLLLHAGMRSMAIRYPIAVAVAYVAFLGLVALWLRRYRLRERRRTRDAGADGWNIDVVDLGVDGVWRRAPSFEGFGGGGGFSGGGGGASWGGEAPRALVPPPRVASTATHSGFGGWDLDVDEGGLWLIPVIIVGALALGAIAYVVIVAPALFAELLLDAGLAAGLYRRLARVERRAWLVTAVRNTVIPACIVAVLLAAAGEIMQLVYPDAASIGAVVRHERARREARRHPSG